MIHPDKARSLAYDWHGGQESALYAFASSGLVEDPVALGREIIRCQVHATTVRDINALKRLDEFVAEKVPPTRPGAVWPHYAAPWARKEYV